MALGEPPSARLGAASNAVPFVVHPHLASVAASAVTTTAAGGETLCAATITLTFDAPVGRAQRATLLLTRAEAGAPPRAYAFEAAPRPSGPSDPVASLTVSFAVEGVSAGTYVARAAVDGAGSALLSVGEADPRVTLP